MTRINEVPAGQGNESYCDKFDCLFNKELQCGEIKPKYIQDNVDTTGSAK